MPPRIGARGLSPRNLRARRVPDCDKAKDMGGRRARRSDAARLRRRTSGRDSRRNRRDRPQRGKVNNWFHALRSGKNGAATPAENFKFYLRLYG